jgi:hypothetical protein
VHALCTHAEFVVLVGNVKLCRVAVLVLVAVRPFARSSFPLIKEADQTLNLISGLLAEFADSAEKLLTLRAGAEVEASARLAFGISYIRGQVYSAYPKKEAPWSPANRRTA